MVAVHTSIEISASPEQVRQQFLDFPSWSQWTKDWFKRGPEILTPSRSSPFQLEKGDKLKVELTGMTFSPVVEENSTAEFRWVGSVPLLFAGAHYFRFQASEKTAGHTTFMQGEKFTGPLASVLTMVPGMFDPAKMTKGFSGFNEDLKRRCEGK